MKHSWSFNRWPGYVWLILLAFPIWAQTPLRFAWLTDTHVGASNGARDLQIVIRDINARGEAQFVIVSGDITELDAGDNLITARQILDSLTIPYAIIPGNHDTKWTASGGETFHTLWGDDRFNVEVGEYRFIGIHQGPLLRMADGYIDPDDISWVDSVLQAMPDQRQKVFIVQHYPLDESVNNWYRLQEVIRPYNIQAILHGHGHRNRVLQYEGIPGIMSRSTLQRGDQPVGYSLVTLHPDSAGFQERNPQSDHLFQWYTLPLGDNTFPDSLRLPLPDFSYNSRSKAQVVWQISSGAIITSAPAISRHGVFVSSTNGDVYNIDLQSGKLQWIWEGSASIHATPLLKRGLVVIGAVDSSITALRAKDGRMMWQTHAGAPILGSGSADFRSVYFGTGDGRLLALKLKTGALNWINQSCSGYIETTPVIHGKMVVYGAWDNGLYAVNRRSGKLIWKWEDGTPGLLYSPAACLPVISSGKVFIVAPDRVMSAIELSSGKTVWRKKGHKVRETIGISESGRQIYARTMQDSVLAIHAESSNFDLRWIKAINFGYDISPNAMIEKQGTLYFSTKDGWVYALDPENGDLKWKYRVSDGLVNTVAAVDGKSVVCTAADGSITFIQEKQ